MRRLLDQRYTNGVPGTTTKEVEEGVLFACARGPLPETVSDLQVFSLVVAATSSCEGVSGPAGGLTSGGGDLFLASSSLVRASPGGLSSGGGGDLLSCLF